MTDLAAGTIFIGLGMLTGFHGGTGGPMGLSEPAAVAGWEARAQYAAGRPQTRLYDTSPLGMPPRCSDDLAAASL